MNKLSIFILTILIAKFTIASERSETVVVWGEHISSSQIKQTMCNRYGIVEYISKFRVKEVMSGDVPRSNVSFHLCHEWNGRPFDLSSFKDDDFIYTPHDNWLLILNTKNKDHWVRSYTTPIKIDTDGKPYVCNLTRELEKNNKFSTLSQQCSRPGPGSDIKFIKTKGYRLESIKGI